MIHMEWINRAGTPTQCPRRSLKIPVMVCLQIEHRARWDVGQVVRPIHLERLAYVQQRGKAECTVGSDVGPLENILCGILCVPQKQLVSLQCAFCSIHTEERQGPCCVLTILPPSNMTVLLPSVQSGCAWHVVHVQPPSSAIQNFPSQASIEGLAGSLKITGSKAIIVKGIEPARRLGTTALPQLREGSAIVPEEYPLFFLRGGRCLWARLFGLWPNSLILKSIVTCVSTTEVRHVIGDGAKNFFIEACILKKVRQTMKSATVHSGPITMALGLRNSLHIQFYRVFSVYLPSFAISTHLIWIIPSVRASFQSRQDIACHGVEDRQQRQRSAP